MKTKMFYKLFAIMFVNIFVFASPALAVTYATFDPGACGSNIGLTNGNNTASITASGAWQSCLGTVLKSSGKWYWEYHVEGSQSGTDFMHGIGNASVSLNNYLGFDVNGWSWYNGAPGQSVHNNSFVNVGTAYTIGDYLGYALDMDNGTVDIYKNCTHVTQLFSGLSGTIGPAVAESNTGNQITANFGASAFHCSVPAGFESGLCAESSCGGGGGGGGGGVPLQGDVDAFFQTYPNLITNVFVAILLVGITVGLYHVGHAIVTSSKRIL